MDNMPVDILHETLWLLVEDTKTLAACALVSKLWSHIARPLRHRRLCIDLGKALESTVAANETEQMLECIARFIKDLKVYTTSREATSSSGQRIFKTIESKATLEAFCLHGDLDTRRELVEEFTESALYRLLFMPTILHLEVNGIPLKETVLTSHPNLESLCIYHNCVGLTEDGDGSLYTPGYYTFNPKEKDEKGASAITYYAGGVVGRHERFSNLLWVKGWSMKSLLL